MIIVVEGPDLSGKSTLAKNLATELGYKYIKWPYSSKILEKCPDESGETFLNTIKQFKDVDMVLDRGFISNIVYVEAYDRDYDFTYIYNLVEELNPIFISLEPTSQVIHSRYEKRGDDFVNKLELEKLIKIYYKVINNLKSIKGWNINSIPINEIDYSPLDKALKICNVMHVIESRIESLHDNGNEIACWSNYHNEDRIILEEIGECQWVYEEIYKNIEGVEDKDYDNLEYKIDKVVDILNDRPTDRGAIIINPNAEYGDCVCLWQFLIRDHELITITYIRSSDVIRKLETDIKMSRWLTGQIHSKLRYSINIGRMLLVQGSSHIYID